MQTVSFERRNRFVCPIRFIYGDSLELIPPPQLLHSFLLKRIVCLTLLLSFPYSVFLGIFLPRLLCGMTCAACPVFSCLCAIAFAGVALGAQGRCPSCIRSSIFSVGSR